MEPAINNKPLKQWTDEERVTAVKRIFNAISPRYDLLNRIMSGRQDIRWRRFAVSRLPGHAKTALDVATGTGDLAIDIATVGEIEVFGVDFVEQMMRFAVEKTETRKLSGRITYAAADALHLPFPDNTFDAATMAFGIRNMPDRLSALKEMARVVKSGGKVIVLEMTFPRNLRLRRFFTWYLNNVIPVLGGIISGNRSAYRYLPDSIQDFLHPDDLAALFQKAGLHSISEFPLTFGLTYLHEGYVS
ncbi:MAG: bifunctional demethylmenaquinone methyltransferase/2-methoxy-6-polyprenyl-1,4-benzoquinol methylase UbiE [Desulfomonile tiedjei]|uniref:Demethylmenaquinone methyltransferase n=1 Tax=Desulfomonile tiedjei TaxID=2358 RepID=A0A9D6V302_9BACT|nr:bifunctional demethylmenaquinone methyltransferase/2-methoxy-6-polyprenyl-1,4-benzoquinol methylase UbiE [Desulfomonile tiedjei]